MRYQTEGSKESLAFAKEIQKSHPGFLIHQDEAIVAINKPAGILTTGATKGSPVGAGEIVRIILGSDIHPVHQLDKDTSGLLLLGNGKGSRRYLSDQFENRVVTKRYIALVDGVWDPQIAGIIAPLTPDAPVCVSLSAESKKAATSFQQLALLEDEKGSLRSLLWVRIHTGRTHQIRAHLSHLGFPITGDQMYNFEPAGFPRQLLHAAQITFCHPQSEEQMTLHAPLAADFYQFLSKMSLRLTSDLFENITSESLAD